MLPVSAYRAIMVAMKKPVMRTTLRLMRKGEMGQINDFIMHLLVCILLLHFFFRSFPQLCGEW
jgi:hypothetical protein